MKVILITALSLLLPVSIVASQFLELSGTTPVTFDQVDRDQNGLLSRQEAVNGSHLQYCRHQRGRLAGPA
jgi:hypothetical protein